MCVYCVFTGGNLLQAVTYVFDMIAGLAPPGERVGGCFVGVRSFLKKKKGKDGYGRLWMMCIMTKNKCGRV